MQSINDAYEQLSNPERIFYELENVQNNTLAYLVAKGIVDNESYQRKNIRLVLEQLPSNLKKVLKDDVFRSTLIFELLSKELPSQRMNGNSGLKKKTGLMEYHYD